MPGIDPKTGETLNCGHNESGGTWNRWRPLAGCVCPLLEPSPRQTGSDLQRIRSLAEEMGPPHTIGSQDVLAWLVPGVAPDQHDTRSLNAEACGPAVKHTSGDLAAVVA